MNGFGSLLDKNKRGAPTTVKGAPATQKDTGFKQALPFQPGGSSADDKEDGADDPNAEQAAPPNGSDGADSALSIHASTNGSRVKTLGTFAGGLIVAVILGHLLLLRREVNQAAPLEEAPPAT